MTELRAKPGTVLVVDEKEELSKHFVIPDEARIDVSGIGRVVGVSKNAPVNLGDRVIYHRYEVEIFDWDSQVYALLPFDSVMCVIDPEVKGLINTRDFRNVADPLSSPLAMRNRAKMLANRDAERAAFTERVIQEKQMLAARRREMVA
jgi:co-chaperonin GroES (HSP10)